MKVSVIVPVYNEEEVIEDCLFSLLGQTKRDLEIIVVDDGSTDSTLKKVSQIKDSRIAILKEKHGGAGAARNRGAEIAKGEILVFVDADMTFDENFIENLTKPIIENQAIGTFSKEEYLENKDNVWAVCWNINRGLLSGKMHPLNFPKRQKVFRAILKKYFIKAMGFNEKMGYTDDWSLSERLGVEAINAQNSIFYHKNPSNLKEVFIQSRWMGKRNYKFGKIGSLAALFRSSLPFSIILGLIKSLKYKIPHFFIFKIISDFGVFLGIVEFYFLGKVSK